MLRLLTEKAALYCAALFVLGAALYTAGARRARKIDARRARIAAGDELAPRRSA